MRRRLNRQQAAALASFHELDVEIYSQHKDRHQAGVVGTKADGATADGAGAVGEARGGLPSMVRGGSTRLLDHEVPTRPSKGKWHTMVYSARGVLTKNKDDAGKGGSVRARKLEALVKAELPSAKVTINAEKPRKGCFEVKVNGEVSLSLLDMPRPFTKLKALDMEEVAADVIKACK